MANIAIPAPTLVAAKPVLVLGVPADFSQLLGLSAGGLVACMFEGFQRVSTQSMMPFTLEDESLILCILVFSSWHVHTVIERPISCNSQSNATR